MTSFNNYTLKHGADPNYFKMFVGKDGGYEGKVVGTYEDGTQEREYIPFQWYNTNAMADDAKARFAKPGREIEVRLTKDNSFVNKTDARIKIRAFVTVNEQRDRKVEESIRKMLKKEILPAWATKSWALFSKHGGWAYELVDQNKGFYRDHFKASSWAPKTFVQKRVSNTQVRAKTDQKSAVQQAAPLKRAKKQTPAKPKTRTKRKSAKTGTLGLDASGQPLTKDGFTMVTQTRNKATKKRVVTKPSRKVVDRRALSKIPGSTAWAKSASRQSAPTVTAKRVQTTKPKATPALTCTRCNGWTRKQLYGKEECKCSKGRPVQQQKRFDKDGKAYTKEEFVTFYGGTKQWDRAAAVKTVFKQAVNKTKTLRKRSQQKKSSEEELRELEQSYRPTSSQKQQVFPKQSFSLFTSTPKARKQAPARQTASPFRIKYTARKAAPTVNAKPGSWSTIAKKVNPDK